MDLSLIYWISFIAAALGGGVLGAIVTSLLVKRPRPVSEPGFEKLSKTVDSLKTELPQKVLKSIQGNTATLKGDLAEHVAYLKLASQYDRLIPLGSVVDFIGIRFDTTRQATDGTIDFIDIKTGKHSRLSQEQMKVKRLILGHRTAFMKVKINTDYQQPDPGVDKDAD